MTADANRRCSGCRYFAFAGRRGTARSALAAVGRVLLWGGLMAPSGAVAAEAAPRDLAQMRSAFAVAAAAKDVKALQALTRFPLQNDVYGEPKSISRAAFARHVDSYRQMADCIRTAPLERDVHAKAGANAWLLNCNGNVFYFVSEKGRWVHSEYQNINE